jgi:hypothetical protein
MEVEGAQVPADLERMAWVQREGTAVPVSSAALRALLSATAVEAAAAGVETGMAVEETAAEAGLVLRLGAMARMENQIRVAAEVVRRAPG